MHQGEGKKQRELGSGDLSVREHLALPLQTTERGSADPCGVLVSAAWLWGLRSYWEPPAGVASVWALVKDTSSLRALMSVPLRSSSEMKNRYVLMYPFYFLDFRYQNYLIKI